MRPAATTSRPRAKSRPPAESPRFRGTVSAEASPAEARTPAAAGVTADDAAAVELLRAAKRLGFSRPHNARIRCGPKPGFPDAQISAIVCPKNPGTTEAAVRELRHAHGIRPVFHTVDTCAAEFAARTPYLYSTYDDETEVPGGDRPKVIILGSGPNRIGQGIEFDYACVHASFALSQAGYETVMVNCNPETVSTDYDTSGRLYFEPLTLEDVLE